MPTGLEASEIIAISAMCAIGWLSIASMIGATLAWWVCRERDIVAATAPAPAPTSEPVRDGTHATPTYA
ncbi:unnamed protein product [Gemmata massiliana]|uniref:Uncharacterized protein n=1 Tax=Gemmata massiliana TaxID=1210884 RepID=A0A6P2D0I0_9BACT|nr:hypothetical protein [Gemmata massiliana]VTR94878.1 unnamed protein product [Gemmata massiliana]